MASPQQIQERIIRESEQTGDPFNQFEYLLTKASQLDEMPEERKHPDVLVKDCQSQVWLYLHNEGGRPIIEADSDTLMIRGTIQILKEMFDYMTEHFDELAENCSSVKISTEFTVTKENDVWKITYVGADIKMRCEKCERIVMLERPVFEKRVKKLVESAVEAEA